ncbi:MAG: transglycosylase SLT domain-containing protein [Cyanobacteria bacterium J06639_18]
MLKKLQKKQISLIAGAGICAFFAGAMLSAPQIGESLSQLFILGGLPEKLSEKSAANSPVLALSLQPLQDRENQLKELIKKSSPRDKNRARYLLASDLIDRREAASALELLEDLDKEYKVLAPYVLLKKAHAYDILKKGGQASDMRQAVIKRFPKHPATAKALYLIGAKDYQDRAIADFPSHPLTWEIIKGRLQENPDQPELKLILARHAFDQPGMTPILEQLLEQNLPDLKPEDWEAIATGLWRKNEFGKAATAYERAAQTPRNIYRVARGHQISNDRLKANDTYQKLIEEFPKAEEAGMGLMRLAEMQKNKKDALPYLDQIIGNFPRQAGAALIKKSKILEAQKDEKGAREALKLLIEEHKTTKEAAEYRWEVALKKAKEKNYKAAWQWAEPIPLNNPDSILAPRAGFWVGKWATKLGEEQKAKEAYKYVIANFPYSYYSWRSASVLGLDVGNFNSVRQLSPEISPLRRSVPPTGTEVFKELYLLGQDRDAWLQWETEFNNQIQPSVAEQFTEGLMRLTKGDYLAGISKVAKLEDRTKPEEIAEYQALSKRMAYWQARYPFPYFQLIRKWSRANKVNPLLVVGLMRQESRFQRNIRSVANAAGLMQVLPSTAEWIAPKIGEDFRDFELTDPSDNIRLGTWYLNYTHNKYQGNSLLAIASYNAGPGNVNKWLKTIPREDPDEFVEAIPFNETKNYVRQVLGNYWNYLRLYNPKMSKLVAKYSEEHPKLPHQEGEEEKSNK